MSYLFLDELGCSALVGDVLNEGDVACIVHLTHVCCDGCAVICVVVCFLYMGVICSIKQELN